MSFLPHFAFEIWDFTEYSETCSLLRIVETGRGLMRQRTSPLEQNSPGQGAASQAEPYIFQGLVTSQPFKTFRICPALSLERIPLIQIKWDMP
jgi:hypothetical protein